MRVKPLQLHTNETKPNFGHKRENYYGQQQPALSGMLIGNNRNLDLYANMADINISDFIPCEPYLNIPEESHFRRALKYIFGTLWQLGFLTAIIYTLLATNKFFNFYEHFTISKTDNDKSLNEEFCNGVNKNVLEKLHKMNLNYKSVVFKLKSSLNELDRLRLEIAALKSELKNLNVTNEIIEAIDKYDADKIGVIDYALEPIGGAIISTPDTTPYPSQMAFNVLGLLSVQYSSNPRVVIQPTTQPGECFAFYGHHGKIRIYLARKINITSVTLEHAHRSLLVDTASTPKEFSVLGLLHADSKEGDLLGTYVYDINGRPLQTFNVTYITKRPKSYQHVELQILSNYGKKEYTCVYRFRVHGKTSK